MHFESLEPRRLLSAANDRIADVVVLSDSGVQVLISDGNGFTESRANLPGTDAQDAMVADFTGDGDADVMARFDGQWLMMDVANPEAFQPFGRWADIAWHDVSQGDFNGDGLLDIVGRTSSYEWWLVSNSGGGRGSSEYLGRWKSDAAWKDVVFADFTGDGRTDIAGRVGREWWLSESTASGLRTSFWGRWADVDWQDVSVGQFNGSALPDIAGRAPDGTWWVAASTGSNFVTQFMQRWSTETVWHDLVVADFDRDGFDDLVARTDDGEWWRIDREGDRFASGLWAKWSAAADWNAVLAADFTDDGLPDLLGRAGEAGWWLSPGDDSRRNIPWHRSAGPFTTALDGLVAKSTSRASSVPVRLEAEEGVLSGSAETDAFRAGYSGDGYVRGYTAPGAAVAFQVDVPTAGQFYATTLYANGKPQDGTLSAYVNGIDVRQLRFPPTTAGEQWSTATALIPLPAGASTLEYRYDGDDAGGIFVDYIWLTKEAANGPIGEPIRASGLEFEVSKLARIPDVSNRRPSLINFAVSGNQMFVGEQKEGRIYEIVRDGSGGASVRLFFDVGAAVTAQTGRNLNLQNQVHGGLRGLAFHPNFAANGKFYTSIMEDRPANPAGHRYLSDHPQPIPADSVLVEWTFNHQTGRVTGNSYREVFRVGMPVYDHPIKQIAFDPFARPGDENYGLLYITHGDGSVQSATAGGGQNSDALGKVMRINPLRNGQQPYSVPAGNPFVGNPAYLDELYAVGFRNPHNLSFAQDAEGRSHLIVVDAGRDNIEEVNLVVAGGNYGWSQREGSYVHVQAGGGIIQGLSPLPEDEATNGFVYPAAEWGHIGDVGQFFVGQAIAGGYVVDNGSALQGQYVFAEFAKFGRIFTADFAEMRDAVTTLDADDPARDHPTDLTQARIWEPRILFDHDNDPTTPSLAKNSLKDVVNDEPTYDGSGRVDLRFGQGPQGELYILNKRNGFVYLVNSSVAPS